LYAAGGEARVNRSRKHDTPGGEAGEQGTGHAWRRGRKEGGVGSPRRCTTKGAGAAPLVSWRDRSIEDVAAHAFATRRVLRLRCRWLDCVHGDAQGVAPVKDVAAHAFAARRVGDGATRGAAGADASPPGHATTAAASTTLAARAPRAAAVTALRWSPIQDGAQRANVVIVIGGLLGTSGNVGSLV
jgi:hypothetical protein